MKALSSVVCIICLLMPAISVADQSCFPGITKTVEDGGLSEEAIQSMMAGEWNEEQISAFIAASEEISGLLAGSEEITPAANINTYLCYYLGYEAITYFINCLPYFSYYGYYCSSAVLYGLAYAYFCM